MTRESLDLMADVYPDVPIRGDISGYQTLLSIDKARHVLGYDPQHTWREYVPAVSSASGVRHGE
jgi:UDP-glucose 4-epimerase